MLIKYQIHELEPYINWVYFFFAWKVRPESDEAQGLKLEAVRMLHLLNAHYSVRAVVELFKCNSLGDDIILQHPTNCPCCRMNPRMIGRLPMLRQQTPDADGYCKCLSDFIRPMGQGVQDTIGIFATSVPAEMQGLYPDDPYKQMLVQTLSDRLAEAAAEVLHLHVRKTYWGYAPDENLSVEQLHTEQFQGIRPAVGYPCLPDISLNFLLDEYVPFSQVRVELTENGMMYPHASISGLMISHPAAQYFSVGRITEQQLEDYAARRGKESDEIKKYLSRNVE